MSVKETRLDYIKRKFAVHKEARATFEAAEKAYTDAQENYRRALKDTADAIAPSDIRPGEKIAVWIDEYFVVVECDIHTKELKLSIRS